MAATEVRDEQNDPTRSPLLGPLARLPGASGQTKLLVYTGGTRALKLHHLICETWCQHFPYLLQQHDPNIQSPISAGTGHL